MVKRVGFVVLGLLIVAVAAIAYYFIQLTAPVPVSNTLPVAPTLAAPTVAAQTAPPTAAQTTPAVADQAATPAGTPQANQGARPRGTFVPGQGRPPGTFVPGRGGFPPGTFVPGQGGFPPPGPGGPGGPGGFGGPVSTAPPAAPTLAPAATGAARVYAIDAAQSQASYNVNETFLQDYFGHAAGKTITVGTTKAIAGDILVDSANPAASKLGEIVVDISQLKSDTGLRDNAIRRQWLDSAQYPLATFQNATITGLPATWPQGQPVKVQIAGDLTIHGATHPATWDATVTLAGATLKARATTTFKMSDYGVQPPSLPALTIEDPVTITLDLVAPAT